MPRALVCLLFLVPAPAFAQDAASQATRWRIVEVERTGNTTPWPNLERARRGRRDLRTALLTAGSVLFWPSYTLDALFSQLAGIDPFTGEPAQESDPWRGYRDVSLAPFVGPWAQLALVPGGAGELSSALLITDGLTQAAGLTLTILALAVR